MYHRHLEGKQRVFTVGGKPQPTALEMHIQLNRSKAADRMENSLKRSDVLRERANARFRSRVGVKTGARV